MPAIALLSPEGWAEVRKAYELGVLPSVLSERYDVPVEAIKKRKQREGWKSLDSVQNEVKAMQKVRDESQGLSSDVPCGVKTAAEVLLANGETGSLKASQLLLSLLQKASPNKLQPLQDVGDVVTSLKGIRLAAGMDRAGTEVKVNLAMFAGSNEATETGWRVTEDEQSQ